MSEWSLVTSPSKPKSSKKQIDSEWSLANDEQPEGFLEKLPRNIVSGLANLGHSTLNAPHDIAQSFEKEGQKFGELLNQNLPLQKYGINPSKPNFKASNIIPYQQEQNYAQLLGQKGEPTFMDTVIQKGMEYTPELLIGGNALRNIIPHLTRRGASKSLAKAREMGKTKNISPLAVNPDLIEDTRQFFPNTTPYRNLIDEAGYGDYNRLFDLQSDLGKHAGALSKDWFSKANRAHGKAGLQVRSNILNEMKQSLIKEGHEDIADLLTKGQDEYRRYMKFKPYRNALGVAAGAYMLPKNALIDLVKRLVLHSNS